LLTEYKNVNIITYSNLCEKYKINFDTLIIDCEGAFYYILLDMPEILENINLVIIENDFNDINDKIFVDSLFKKNGLKVEYTESLYLNRLCGNNFYEVWKK